MDLPLCALSLVAAVLCLVVVLRWGRGQRRPPVAGTVFHMLKNFHRLYDYQTELSQRHKTFRVLTPSNSYIYTVDPANVEHILKTNFDNYGKGPYISDILKDLLGDGIFAVDGEKWQRQRKVASHEFSTKVLRDFSSVVFRKNATKVVHIISEAATKCQIIDVQGLLMKAMLDSIFEVGCGVDLDTLHRSSEDAHAFAKAFDSSSSLVLHRCFDVFWKFKRLLNIGSEAELKKNIEVIDEFVYKIIRSKREQMAKQQNHLMKKEDILSRFLQESEISGENGNDKHLRDIILCFILAGKDTTAITLSWLIYMLCKYPTIQEKVAQEVKEATGTSDDMFIGNFMENLTEHALNKMQYLHAALTETLRLYPALPMDGKYCFSDDILPDGFKVKRGDTIDYQPYPMGRMRALWGDDVEEFRPERWLSDNGIFQPESPFKFTAFQSGPRICLGKEFAYRQMKIMAATLLHHFVFEFSDEQKVVNYITMLTLKINGGLFLRVFHRRPSTSNNQDISL